MFTRPRNWICLVTATTITRLAFGQESTTPASTTAPGPVAAPRTMVAPVCEWGNCDALCPQGCPAGSVCGVQGVCVEIVSPREIAREVAEVEADERDAIRSHSQRQHARYWPRFSLGGGMGGLSLVDGLQKAGMFVVHFGVRKQLGALVGLHAQLMGTLGLRFEKDASGNSKQLTLYEGEGSIAPYFGPFKRFYIGPALLVGYRWYSDTFVQWFAPGITVQDHLVREGGLRLGILAGNEEQFDITALLTTSFDKDTPQRGLVTFAYEFR